MAEAKRRGRKRGEVKKAGKASPRTQALIDIVNDYLKEKDMSILAFSVACGMSQPGLKRLLDGEYRSPTLDTFSDIARGLGMTPTKLMREVSNRGALEKETTSSKVNNRKDADEDKSQLRLLEDSQS